MTEPEVWYLARAPWEPGEYLGLVADDERARARRFRFREDAGRFLASRALLRVVVARCLDLAPADVVFDRRCAHCGAPDHGRPTVLLPTPVPPVHFSLTRAGPVVAVALGPASLGLDAEPVRAGIEGLLDASVFSARERDWARNAPPTSLPTTRVLEVWVAKEAVGKASGLGLARAEQVHIPLGGQGWRPAHDADGHRCWLTQLELPGAAAAALATYQEQRPDPLRVPQPRELPSPNSTGRW